jgi:hypothetical protein
MLEDLLMLAKLSCPSLVVLRRLLGWASLAQLQQAVLLSMSPNGRSGLSRTAPVFVQSIKVLANGDKLPARLDTPAAGEQQPC